jgi:ankyrin repeat protein
MKNSNLLNTLFCIIYLSLIQFGCGPTFIEATKDGDLETVLKKINTNAEDVDLNRGLYYAARGGYLPIVEALIERGADPNEILTEFNPLHESVYNGHLQVTDFLIQNGADVNIQSKSPVRIIKNQDVQEKNGVYTYQFVEVDEKRTPLIDAIRKSNLDMVSLLLKNKADPNIKFIWKSAHHNVGGGYPASGFGMKTALMVEGNPEPVTLEMGSDGTVTSNVKPSFSEKLSPLQLAHQLNLTEIANILVKYGATD